MKIMSQCRGLLIDNPSIRIERNWTGEQQIVAFNPKTGKNICILGNYSSINRAKRILEEVIDHEGIYYMPN